MNEKELIEYQNFKEMIKYKASYLTLETAELLLEKLKLEVMKDDSKMIETTETLLKVITLLRGN